MSAIPDFPHPVFIGGSARSGTHAVGRLLASHPRYATLGVEARFHCANNGLADLLMGRTDLDSFTKRVLGPWWRRGLFDERGLQVIATREQLESAVAEFRELFPADPWEAGAQLMRSLLDPVPARRGGRAWVDVSGFNVRVAPVLHRLFPRARVIHMLRDGRAVTASILHKRDQTDDREEAFDHWVRRVRASHQGLRELPAGVGLTVNLDELAASARERELARLIELLEIDDPAPMRAHFDREISAERANVDGWRSRLSPADARWVDRRYRAAVRELRREGIDWLPSP